MGFHEAANPSTDEIKPKQSFSVCSPSARNAAIETAADNDNVGPPLFVDISLLHSTTNYVDTLLSKILYHPKQRPLVKFLYSGKRGKNERW